MHKVVIERPRWNPGPNKQRRRANLPDELLPKVEGIRRPYFRRKGLTDLLGPLKRWLLSQAGRPWNDVYSEACAVIKPDSIIRAHVKTHLLEFVQRNTFMRNGRISYVSNGRGIRPVQSEKFFRRVFYVHPETGLLEKIEPVSRKKWRAKQYRKRDERRWIRGNVALQQIRGLWYECHFESIRVEAWFRAYDHALERMISRKDVPMHRSHYLRCKFKRQLSKRELREHGLANSPLQNPSAAASRSGMSLLAIALGFALKFLTRDFQLLAG